MRSLSSRGPRSEPTRSTRRRWRLSAVDDHDPLPVLGTLLVTYNAGERTVTPVKAEGWYLDPFEVHEARWLSDGTPTALVRDGSVESHDAPPGVEFDLPLTPVAARQTGDGDDLLRADAEADPESPGDAAFQGFTETGGNFS